MKFIAGEFSESEQEYLQSIYSFAEKWYSKIIGAQIVGVSFNVSDDQIHGIFPVLKLKMVDGTIFETELTACDDQNTPGWLSGISTL